MATTEQSIIGVGESQRSCNLTICHFTTAHAELKSRSFHREFVPLARSGAAVRYLAPVNTNCHRDGIDIVALTKCSNRLAASSLSPPF